MSRYDKVISSMLAAAVGDSLGSVTETMTTEQIVERYHGLVTELLTPPEDVYAAGFPLGSVTDDFSLAYYTALSIIYHDGIIDESTAEEALVEWSRSPYFKLAGPSTAAGISKILGEEVTDNSFHPVNENEKGTNGAAMKIFPVGLAADGDVDKAIKDAITIIWPTHDNNTSLAAGCAVAAAVAAATKDEATIDSIFDAGIKGALYGEEYARTYGKTLANPSVYNRLILAKVIGRKYQKDEISLMQALSDYIGTGISAAESVPTAFGLFIGLKGDPQKCIAAGANIGGDTDTIATIAGAIAGAYQPYWDKENLNTINQANGFNLEWVAGKLVETTGNE